MLTIRLRVIRIIRTSEARTSGETRTLTHTHSFICLAADAVLHKIQNKTVYTNSTKSQSNDHKNLQKYMSENCAEHIKPKELLNLSVLQEE